MRQYVTVDYYDMILRKHKVRQITKTEASVRFNDRLINMKLAAPSIPTTTKLGDALFSKALNYISTQLCINDFLDLPGDSDLSGLTLQLFQMVILTNEV